MKLNLKIKEYVINFADRYSFSISARAMDMDMTPLMRPYFVNIARRTDKWGVTGKDVQLSQLRSLLHRASGCEVGRRYGFAEMAKMWNPYGEFSRRVPLCDYEMIRADVMRMIRGERDVLWRGRCLNYAQSSGTSGGKSKYIPITGDSLRRCHYKGAADSVAHYLRSNPGSRLFSGKGMILGGSFANELDLADGKVRVGDLSATLIDKINPLINLFRVPDKHTALLPDWSVKLPALVAAAKDAHVTNMSGVPSWFLTVSKEIVKARGVKTLSEAWPDLEVFFHGGISFEPYREEYDRLTNPDKMHYVENYNASEGFFAVQNDPSDRSMLLTVDNDIFYEFIAASDPAGNPVPVWDLENGKVYELLISSSNGLWRYRIGDTVRVYSTSPVKIRVSGRTRCFINAFGEELMEENAERAMAEVCRQTGASIVNYTAAPVFAEGNRRGRHQWLVEWGKRPCDDNDFARRLDAELRKLNSDYDAKRRNTIFLDPPEIVDIPNGIFDRWLHSVGNGKLGGQRKIPRLSNDRKIADAVLEIIG